LLIESLKARLLRATQPLNRTLREPIRAQQLTLLAFPKFAVPEIVCVGARSDQWQLEFQPAALLQYVTGQIVFANAMRNDHDATFFGIVQTGLDLVVKKIIDTLKPLGVVAVFNLDRVIDDDDISTEAGNTALDRERAHAAAIGGDKIDELRPVFFYPRVESLLKPVAAQDVANSVGIFVGKVLAIGQDDNFGGRIVREGPRRHADGTH